MSNGNGGQTRVSVDSFSIVTDSSNAEQTFIVALTPAPEPEPVTSGLMGAGLVLLGLLGRQRHGGKLIPEHSKSTATAGLVPVLRILFRRNATGYNQR
jgi:hypothetical protein